MLRYFIVLLVLTACSSPKPEETTVKKTQDEIRQMQTKQFDTKNNKLVMKSVLQVLQDDNYVVRNAAMDLGFLTATLEKNIQDDNADFWSKFQKPDAIKWPKCELIEATVSMSEYGTGTRLRMNFQKKIIDNTGAIMSVNQITDEKFYQEFFNKVQQNQN